MSRLAPPTHHLSNALRVRARVEKHQSSLLLSGSCKSWKTVGEFMVVHWIQINWNFARDGHWPWSIHASRHFNIDALSQLLKKATLFSLTYNRNPSYPSFFPPGCFACTMWHCIGSPQLNKKVSSEIFFGGFLAPPLWVGTSSGSFSELLTNLSIGSPHWGFHIRLKIPILSSANQEEILVIIQKYLL